MKKLSSTKPQVRSWSQPPTFKQAVTLLLITTVALFAVSGFYWYKSVLTDPSRVLNDMLDKSLQTASVSRTVTESGGASNREQIILTSFSPQVTSHSLINLEEQNGAAKTTVSTEVIGTRNADYVRYKELSVEGGPKQDYSKVEGIWAKQDIRAAEGESSRFLGDALFMVVPFGNLNRDQRDQVKSQAAKLNVYNIKDAKVEWQGGRPVMAYTIDLDPQTLIGLLASYGKTANISELASLDPSQYASAEKVQLKLNVDLLSRHVKDMEFANSGRKETYTGYGVIDRVALPNKTISLEELQSRVQAIGQQ